MPNLRGVASIGVAQVDLQPRAHHQLCNVLQTLMIQIHPSECTLPDESVLGER